MKKRHVEHHNGRSGLEFWRYDRGPGVTVQRMAPRKGWMPAVTRDDWKRKPLPEKRTAIPLGQAYSTEEFSLIRRGLVPQRMEDQWFIFCEGDALFFHRSWTGHCIYVVHFQQTGDKLRATYVDVNREPNQYGETDEQRDRERVLELIHVLLLQRSALNRRAS